MGGATNHPVVTTAEGWFRAQEKRTLHEERRPRITHARDLMGPGLAPQAVEVRDWNAEETTFNGFFYSEPGALHSPDPTADWIGMVIATPTGHGLQHVWKHSDSGLPTHYVRTFHTHILETPIYSSWALA